jgi:hypothetical protein
MTPHYDWTPASEPPDTERIVMIWLIEYGEEFWKEGSYFGGSWCERGTVTHWRDIEPPMSSVQPSNEHPEWLHNVCAYISDTLAEGTPSERTIARTIMHMLPFDNVSPEVES